MIVAVNTTPWDVQLYLPFPESGSFSIASPAVGLYCSCICTSCAAIVFFSSLTEMLQGKWCEAGALYSFTVTAKYKLPAFLTDRVFLLSSSSSLLEELHWSGSFISAPRQNTDKSACLFNIWAPLSWDKLNVIHLKGSIFFNPPGKKPRGILQSRLNLLLLKMEENIHTDTSTLVFRPLLPIYPLSIFTFLSSPLFSPLQLFIADSVWSVGMKKMLSSRRFIHPGRKWKRNREGQEMYRELALFSHTSCPKELHHRDLCQDISDTSLSLHKNTLWHTWAGKSFSLDTRLGYFIVKHN